MIMMSIGLSNRCIRMGAKAYHTIPSVSRTTTHLSLNLPISHSSIRWFQRQSKSILAGSSYSSFSTTIQSTAQPSLRVDASKLLNGRFTANPKEVSIRWFTTVPPSPPTPPTPPTSTSKIPYEAPFASLALRLKRVSISSAVISIIGIPILIYTQGSGAVPASGQLAVGGTAVLAACGSTAALSYCFSPYVHSLEWITVRCPTCVNGDASNEENEEETETTATIEQPKLIRANTRNMFAMPVETIFDPRTDVVYDGVAKLTNRPFCNFIAKGVPLYVHPALVNDLELRSLLVGGGTIPSSSVDDDTDGDSKDGGSTSQSIGVDIVEGDIGIRTKKKNNKDSL